MNSIKDQINEHAKAIADLEAQLQRDDRLERAYDRSVRLTDPAYATPQPPSRTKFYLDKARGKWLGVCAGIADYTGIDVLWVRLGVALSTFAIFPANLIAYLIVAWVSDTKPAGLYDDAVDAKFWQGVRSNTSGSAKDVRSKLRDIDRRIADIEAHFVSSNRRLADEIDALK